MQEVLVNRLGGVSLPRKSVVRLTDHPDMTLDVYRGRKTTKQNKKKTTKTNSVISFEQLGQAVSVGSFQSFCNVTFPSVATHESTSYICQKSRNSTAPDTKNY